MTDKLEMPLEQFAEAVAKENARLNEEIQLKNAQLVIRRDRITRLISGAGGIMEMKQTISDKEQEIERLEDEIEKKNSAVKLYFTAFNKAAERIKKLEEALDEIAVWDDGDIGPHMDEPCSASKARIALIGDEVKKQ